MKKNIAISVSTDPIEEYQEILEYSKEMQDIAEFLHCDIMDGQFVSNKTYDANIVSNINQNSLMMLDVHLMMEEPLLKLDDYIRAGANIITVHYEAFENKENLHKALKKIKFNGVLAGLSLNPSTAFREVKVFCYNIDVVLVMGVEPGCSGQKMMPSTVERVREIAAYRDSNNLHFKIEVDGGVNAENANELIEAGADILVSGSFVFKAVDRQKALEQLRGNESK